MKTTSCLEDSNKPYSHATILTTFSLTTLVNRLHISKFIRNSVLKIIEYTAMNELSGGVDENLEFYPFCFKKKPQKFCIGNSNIVVEQKLMNGV